MSRTVIPVNEIVRSGLLEPSTIAGDFSNGHSFENNGRVWVEITNNNGSANVNVTFESPLVSDGLDVADLVVTVTDGDTIRHGPFNTQTFNQDGLVLIDIDSSGLEFAAFKLATS